MARREDGACEDDGGLALLLVQLGCHAATCLVDDIAPLGLDGRQFWLLRCLAAEQGQSQQALGDMLRLNPTRMVFLVDDLEKSGVVERRRNPEDRRSHAIYITSKGQRVLDRAQAAARRNDERLGGALSVEERQELARLLRVVAAHEGLDEARVRADLPKGIG